jgi:hypothetical protein
MWAARCKVLGPPFHLTPSAGRLKALPAPRSVRSLFDPRVVGFGIDRVCITPILEESSETKQRTVPQASEKHQEDN